MYVKLYAAVWGLLLLVAAGLAVSGNFGIKAAIAYGFITFGLTFMGMMSVLPSIVSTPEGRESLCPSNRRDFHKKEMPEKSARALHEWLFPTGVEMSEPKHH